MTGHEHPHPVPASHKVGIAELIEVAHRLAPGRNRASIVFVDSAAPTLQSPTPRRQARDSGGQCAQHAGTSIFQPEIDVRETTFERRVQTSALAKRRGGI